jgi:hypothetical protein
VERKSVMAIYKLTSSIVVNIANGTVPTAGQTRPIPVPVRSCPRVHPNGCCDAQDADGAQKMWNVVTSADHRSL